MTSVMRDLLLVQSFDLTSLIEEYRQFFIAIIPSIFILAIIIEYFDRLEPFSLVRRAVISILILTSITSFYQSSIFLSINTADSILSKQKNGNILLMDMLDGMKHWAQINKVPAAKDFYDNKGALSGTYSFFKYHLFDSFVNDGFTITVYFITKVCFLILKVVYSLVYYLGYGLIGIPCLLYIFPSMGNVLRGAVLSFLWCLVIPHILVFIISMIGVEINKGYTSGQVIGGSIMGTALLFILTLFIAFTPLIGAMILNGSGISQAGGIIATVGANYVMNLPKNAVNSASKVLTGGALGPKMKLATAAVGGSYRMAKGAKNLFSNLDSGDSFKESPINNQKSSASSSKSQNSVNTQGANYSSDSGNFRNSKNSRNSEKFQDTKTSGNSTKNNSREQINTGGTNNGAIPKHGRVNPETKEATNLHRPNKRNHSYVHPRNRGNAQQR